MNMLKKLQQNFLLIPIFYLFVSIFIARNNVEFVYASVAALLAITLILHFNDKQKDLMILARWMSVLSAIGLSAAVILSIEKVELLLEPGRIASCSISPIVACSPVISSNQASALGFPNSFIGIFGFTAVFTASATILAGANKLNRNWWRALLGGITLGAVFCTWLFYEGVFNIGKLCLYCLLVWLVTFALLWLVAAYSIKYKYITLGNKLNSVLSHKIELITGTYVLIFLLIVYRWSDYWFSLL
jgi:uncharacterized membrane protein